MKKYIFIFFLFFVACANSKSVYWCGDHACVNKEEKRLYFKKHMVVEVKQIGEKKVKKKEYYEKIFEQAKINKKQSISENKLKLKREKKIVKKIKKI